MAETIRLAELRQYSRVLQKDAFISQLGPFLLLASRPEDVPPLDDECATAAFTLGGFGTPRNAKPFRLKEQWNRLSAVVLPPLRETDALSVGRAFTNDVVLDDLTGSKFHATVGWNHSACANSVTDLASRNGTFVNGRQIAPGMPTKIANGDVLRFGSNTFVILSTGVVYDVLHRTETED